MTAFSSSDIITLQCIRNAQQKETGASLEQIITYWDYLDHSLPEYHELIPALKKLGEHGLIHEVKNGWSCCDSLNDAIGVFYAGRKSAESGKERKWLQENLLRILSDNLLEKPSSPTLISEAAYQEVISRYINSIQKT